MNKKRAFIFLLVVVFFLTGLYFLPENYHIAWCVLGILVVSVSCLRNMVALKRYHAIAPAPDKRKQAVQPQKQQKFDEKTLIDLAALVSDNDPDVMKEVSEAALNFREYTSYYRSEEWLSDTVGCEKYWERWYPNNKTDPTFMSEYIDDKPRFCCLNMLEWLSDKDYVAYIDHKWTCDELIHSVRKLVDKKNIPLEIAEIKWLPDQIAQKGRSVVHTHQNLMILDEHLADIGYCLINLDRDGDCYDLAVVSEQAYNRIMCLDLAALGDNLSILSFRQR